VEKPNSSDTTGGEEIEKKEEENPYLFLRLGSSELYGCTMDATSGGACGAVGGWLSVALREEMEGRRRERFGGKNFWENMAAVSCLTWF
jgi:hypothetical protein